MDNKEDYLEALTAYSKNPTPEIPPILEQYLNGVAKNGETLFQWLLLKPLVVGKMEQVISELKKGLSTENIPTRPNVENVQFDVMHKRIMDSLHKFNGAPFTIQRLCELLIEPKQHYKRSDKFMRGLEKNVLVVSTVDPYGRKVVSDSGNKHLVNGMDLNGSPFFPRDSNLSSNLPPVPGWVTSSVTLSPRLTTNSNTVNTEEEKQLQPAPQEATVTTNGVVSGLVSSLYSDNGEQPLAVQTEEVVEETVVTMDTNDVGPVATDGGEALADDEEEEEMGAEDTNASSTSSSSSSSEELSTSDSGESSGVLSASAPDASSRPWASIANEGENSSENVSQQTGASAVETASDLPPSDQPSTDQSVEQLSTDQPADQTSIDHPADQLISIDTAAKQQADVLDHSFGFDTTPASQSAEAIQQSESTPLSADSESSTESQSISSCSTSSSTLPFNHLRSYADVVSGSNKDSCAASMDVSDSSCDSVTGLERLVDSVETSPPLLSHIQSVASPTTTECEEPKAKRFKSDTENCEMNSHQASSSSPCDITTAEISDLPVSSSDCESDCQLTDTAPDLTKQTDKQSCHPEADSTLVGHSSVEESQPLVEQLSDDSVSQDLDTSSQLTSSNDSQGFDMCKEAERKSSELLEEADPVSTTESMEHE